VVVGTVIDPDMRDELRVTVVATGLGNAPRQVTTEKPSLVQVNRTATGAEDFDRPTVLRNKHKAAQRAQATGGNSAEDLDYLDIPAFLRRQAD
jgi:cell division protein FtsZ